MKHLLQRRLLPVFLCMMLALGLTACGGKDGGNAFRQQGRKGQPGRNTVRQRRSNGGGGPEAGGGVPEPVV